MALIECPECKAKISNKAKACPNCGYPIEQVVLMLCPECKSIISNDMQACPNCGYPMEQNEKVIVCKVNGIKCDFTDFYKRLMYVKEDQSARSDEKIAVIRDIRKLTNITFTDLLCDQIIKEERVPEEYNDDYTMDVYEREQQAKAAAYSSTYVVRCPYCKSTDVKRISLTGKALSIGGLGILSNKIGKTYQCRNCKSTW